MRQFWNHFLAVFFFSFFYFIIFYVKIYKSLTGLIKCNVAISTLLERLDCYSTKGNNNAPKGNTFCLWSHFVLYTKAIRKVHHWQQIHCFVHSTFTYTIILSIVRKDKTKMKSLICVWWDSSEKSKCLNCDLSNSGVKFKPIYFP